MALEAARYGAAPLLPRLPQASRAGTAGAPGVPARGLATQGAPDSPPVPLRPLTPWPRGGCKPRVLGNKDLWARPGTPTVPQGDAAPVALAQGPGGLGASCLHWTRCRVRPSRTGRQRRGHVASDQTGRGLCRNEETRMAVCSEHTVPSRMSDINDKFTPPHPESKDRPEAGKAQHPRNHEQAEHKPAKPQRPQDRAAQVRGHRLPPGTAPPNGRRQNSSGRTGWGRGPGGRRVHTGPLCRGRNLGPREGASPRPLRLRRRTHGLVGARRPRF